MSTERTTRTNEQWLRELRGPAGPSSLGAAAETAQRDLRALVGGAVRKATAGRSNIDDATLDDLTQVAVVHVLRNLERFEGRSKFTTWAYSVAVRAAFSELRKSAYRAADEALTDERSASLESSAPAPTNRAERNEIVAVMHKVIAEELSERQRTAILGDLAGTPQDGLLATLGVNRNAFHKLVHDARKKLKSGLLAAGICDDQVREAFGL